MKAWYVLGFLPLSCTGHAGTMTEEQFQAGRDRLKQTQQQSEVLLQSLSRKMGVQSPFSEHSNSPKRSDEPQTSLFRVHAASQVLQIASGKLLYGKLLNRLIIGGDGSPVLIELDPDQGFLSGLRLMGNGHPAGTPGRVAVEVNRLLLRTGRTIALQAVGLDPEGAYGLNAQVLSGKALAVTGAMASSFISGLAAGTQSQATNSFGFSQVQSTGRNAILQGVAQTAADQSKRLIEEATSEKPILIVESQTSIAILVQEEVKF